ncbi:MAG: lytic murein transglycosylase B [Gallionellales bacterium 35-53-114]|nr:MAG: lytic murein transglycosylase B [Gallionellales bacterium 35-53-114]OYZ63008.1 MAG: lytic murein transglycosylase B [Gallionellales bacterium 24-53-125]OZB09011.1 MAG: lytic murein transglycosylase B [Gallionellales bacterium 39-52-133]HQS59309.1 lytic murein transglycosylase B [Gallionellaceae bacterium]HQS76222.1 lytic murein transglycosylase B [Gallionellaceae bacterium]
MKRLPLFPLFLMLASSVAMAADLPGIPEFINEMVAKHQFRRDELVQVFQAAQHRQDVIDAMNKPSTLKPWPEYRASFVNPKRIDGGMKFWLKHAKALERAETLYGVPQEVIIAIIGVETLYGSNAGNHRTLDALTTLTFDYPRRVDFFRSELEQYLLLAREQSFDMLNIRASYAGAMGIPQFMPSSYRRNAVDFDGDGKIDLLNGAEDAIGSVANYLRQYGWKPGEPVAMRATIGEESRPNDVGAARSLAAWRGLGVAPQGEVGDGTYAYLLDFTLPDGKEFWFGFNNFAVITTYNNSSYYAMSVYQLAVELRKSSRYYGLIRRAPL